MMTAILDRQYGKLQATLEELVRLHERLLPVMEEKREALTKMDRARLAEILVREESLASSIAVVDGARADLVRALAGPLGLPAAPPVRLGALLEKIEDPVWLKTLSALRERLEHVLGRVRRVAETNKALTEQTLGHIRYFLRVLAGLEGVHPTYDRRARARDGVAFPVVERRA
ncbi:MAG: flagellar protein FlgN [Planctomycetes bacterium]|nr:flagellar protein FlgN [Planctomycetota bacterium]